MSGFKKFLQNRYTFVHLFLVVVSIIVAIGVYYVQGSSTQKSLKEQMLHREQLIARAGAISIGDFLADTGKSIVFVASSLESNNFNNKELDTYMDSMLKEWGNTPVVAITLIDKNGKVKANANITNVSDLGVDISDREYFHWAINASKGTYFIQDPVVSKVGYTKGEFIIPVVTPVINENGDFDGALLGVVSLKKLVEKYVNPLKISDSTDIYMLDDSGNLVFSPVPEYLGKNLSDVTSELDFPGRDKLQEVFKEEFAKPGNEGKLDVNLPDLDEGGKAVRSLIAYSGLQVYGNPGVVWYLVIITPASDAFLYTGPFYTDQLVGLICFISMIIVFSIVGITSSKLHNRNA